MGSLNYGSWAVEFDDRLLTHLQIVIINRLRRGDTLLMSWIDSTTIGDGRSSIWLTNAVPMYFKFNGSRVPEIDADWLARLDASAGAPTGLTVVDPDGTPLRAGNIAISSHQPAAAVHNERRH